MTKDEVINLFRLLRAAGLQPPCDMHNEEEQRKLVDTFHERYKHLDGKAVNFLADKLPQLPRWARYYDVDELLREYQRKQRAKQQYETSKDGRITARNNFLMRCLGRPIGIGENWLMAMAERTAKKHFPDATNELVDMNKQVLASQCEKDYICNTCNGKDVKECPFAGHTPLLKIDYDCGLISEAMNVDFCGKVIRNIVADDVNQIGRRGGGFSDSKQLIGNMRGFNER